MLYPDRNWSTEDLDFDAEGRLVIYDKSLQEWFVNKVINGTGSGGAATTTANAGCPPPEEVPAFVDLAVQDCDVIVVGSCGKGSPPLDTKCDLLVVTKCGSGQPPKMDTSCSNLLGVDQEDFDDLNVPSTARIGIIIRDNSEEDEPEETRDGSTS